MVVAASLSRVAALCGLVALLVGCASKVHREQLPIEDDFSGDCKWSEDDDEDVSLGCEDGEYRVLFKSTERTAKHVIFRRLEEPIDSAAVETDATLRAFPGTGADRFEFEGVGCVASPPGHPTRGYLFVVGLAGPEERGFAIVRIDETDQSLREQGYFRNLVDQQSEAVAGIGAQNHIRGECRATKQGVELAMYLNGEQVGTATDPDGFRPFEGFAFFVFASKAGTDVRYDNFSAEEIAEGESG
jgi:hypothetical protein